MGDTLEIIEYILQAKKMKEKGEDFVKRCKDIVDGLDFTDELTDDEIDYLISMGQVVDDDLWIEQLRSLNSENEITDDEYSYIIEHIDELKGE